MNIRLHLCAFLLLFSLCAVARDEEEKLPFPGGKCFLYRLVLSDKNGTPYSITSPEEYLSKRAIERRRRQGLPIDSTDLPITPQYVNAIRSEGVSVVGTSKWNNTVLVRTDVQDDTLKLRQLPFVRRIVEVYSSPDSIKTGTRFDIEKPFPTSDSTATDDYGASSAQIKAMNGQALLGNDHRGQGKLIAIFDGGFMNVDRISCFRKVKIVETRNFGVPYSGDFFSDLDHGTCVLSLMAVHEPRVYMGTAPDAAYVLLKTEVGQSESLSEEDFWAMAAEYADSLGVDVVNSSLGYHDFDDTRTNYHYDNLDGRTALISRTAFMFAAKGMILVNSAGNDGAKTWKKIGVPADADNILAVGALQPNGQNAVFSSVGPTADGRVKPDVMAPGNPDVVVNGYGLIDKGSGTSFASPLVCGLVASLWSAFPDKTAEEIMNAVRRSANSYDKPNNIFGYGTPDFGRAMQLLK